MSRATLAISVCVLCSSVLAARPVVSLKEQTVVVNSESRKAAFRRAVEIWQEGRPDLIEALVTADYVGHTSGGDRDIDGLRKRISEFHALYADIRFKIEDQAAEGDRITTRLTAYGTSKASGRPVHLIGLNISRFVGNRIAEEWPIWEVVR